MRWTVILGLLCTSGNRGIGSALKGTEVCPFWWLHHHNCFGKTLISQVEKDQKLPCYQMILRGQLLSLIIIINPGYPLEDPDIKLPFLNRAKPLSGT